jgi:replication-associated recombination protein RarA
MRYTNYVTSLVEKYRPRSFGDFAGLEGPRAVLTQLAAKPYESAWMLYGPSGLGKTTMAKACADMIGAEIEELPSRKCDLEAVDRITRQCTYVPMSGKAWRVYIVNEANKMSRAAQDAFYSKLDSTDPPPNAIFLFTSNYLLDDMFMSRCRVIPFTFELEPSVALLSRIWAKETKAAPPDFAEVLKESRHNIRQALMTLELELVTPGWLALQRAAQKKAAEYEAAHRLIETNHQAAEASGRKNGSPDPARSEACKRAWVTIRRNRAEKARQSAA